MNIQYYKKDVYGNPLFYVVGAEGAAIKQLTGKKTIDRRDLAALEALGHTTELVHEEGSKEVQGVGTIFGYEGKY